jgi:hypothetical protein
MAQAESLTVSMKFPWVIQLMAADASSLTPLRLISSIEIGQTQECIWVRGRSTDDQLSCLLQSLPARARFEWMPDGRLRPIRSRIPSQALPPISWQPIDEWLQVELRTPDLPGEPPPGIGLSLVRSTHEKPANVLLTDFVTWQNFVLQAPEIRLRPLRFALSAAGQAVIWGVPSPPIPGQRYVEEEGVAISAGFTWWPAVNPKVLRQVFQIGENALVLWQENGCVHLHPEQLVPVTRSGVRATIKSLKMTA